MPSDRPSLDVAVVMCRERLHGNRWQQWQWRLHEVLAWDAGGEPRRMLDDGQRSLWLFPGLQVELWKDDAEGLYLNLSSEQPCFWVLWRLDEAADACGLQLARPLVVSLSYYDAGRWLDAQETVEQVPAPQAVVDWLARFVADHYRPEPKQRRRPQSFLRPAERG
jgi:hypothetical protein